LAIKFDLHTHTIYSHGLGSILDNAKAANNAGLETLGIADHGPGHKGFGLKMKNIPKMREDIKKAKALYPNLKILLGVEANIINPSGNLDVPQEKQGLFDYIVAGYHYGVFGEAPFRACLVHAGGFCYRLFGTSTKSIRNRNTDLVIKALEENSIRILSHPGEKAAFDIEAIAKCCEKRGTWLEINDHHKCLTIEGIKIAEKYDVKFVLSSDAHFPNKVGKVDNSLKRVKLAGLDLKRIVNYV